MTLNEWIVKSSVGRSSKTMWAVLNGVLTKDNIKDFDVDIPYDADDFGRCYTLWKECNINDSDLHKISETLPIWEPFIRNWYKLVDMYNSCDSMYPYMKMLVEEAYLNAGWTKINEYTWRRPS